MNDSHTTARHVAFAADQNFAVPLITAVYSYCRSNPSSTVHVFHEDLTEKTQNSLTILATSLSHTLVFHRVDAIVLAERSDCTVASVATCYRYLLAEMISDAETVLYIDSDTLVRGDLRELFEIRLPNEYAAGCLDVDSAELNLERLRNVAEKVKYPFESLRANYVNAGVLLLNLKKIREDALTEEFFALDAKENLLYRDQDVLNLAFKGKIKHFPRIFNLIGAERYDGVEEPKLIHFTGRAKPWHVAVSPWHEEYRRVWEEWVQFLTEKQGPNWSAKLAYLPLPTMFTHGAQRAKERWPQVSIVLQMLEGEVFDGSELLENLLDLHEMMAKQGVRDKQLDYYLLGCINASPESVVESIPGRKRNVIRFIRRYQRGALRTMRRPWGTFAIWFNSLVH